MDVDALAKKIWNYMKLNHKLKKADCILVLGSHDVRVAKRGAELFLKGYAPLLVFSGGLGALTKGLWTTSEAEIFADVAIKMGVPKNKIIMENKSTNTGENILFTKKLLAEHGINPKSFILVQKPYMERRIFAAFKKNWPGKKAIVTSPQIKYEDYPNDKINKEEIINIMVGDLQRVKIYPSKGFQIRQKIPKDVWQAYEELIKLGYDKRVIKA